ncbi:hypothetical protein [Streptomyces alkaliterrae]|uniref:Uncharacterized protein n=1 Tax=Streptomyces alkaliterrae TaxID=2213162 RepID=A0A7W3X056_9ACTN|nr:hypothetical protein [Streptomyces alkaliterrae]MBB1255571.1 hypothetical protein [Streptomyces alkaliterrae]MBB1261721.1 hypothetical protein [Streptomyces alkaliterrae]
MPVEPSHRRPPTPRWVRVSGVVAVAVLAALVVLHVFGGGGLGPGSHLTGG